MRVNHTTIRPSLAAFVIAIVTACGSEQQDTPTANAAVTEPVAEPKPSALIVTKTADGTSDDRLSASQDPCLSICQHAARLHCAAASECSAACEQMSTVEICRSEMQSFMRCMAREPSEHWQCSPEGTVVLKDGYCDESQAAFARCAGMGT